MNKILVTGASGWIGRHCVPLLVSKGYEVHAVSRNRPADLSITDVSWHEVDLLAHGSATELVRRIRPDQVLHFAWYAEPGKFWQANENLDWVRTSLELARALAESGGKRIVGAGTCAEYESNAGECCESSTRILPDSLYGTSKHNVERYLQSLASETGLSYAWGRIFFLYGPHEHRSRLVAYVVRSVLSGEPAHCSEGTQVLDFLHVEDAASAFLRLLESDAQGPVNIASGRPISVRDVLHEIGRQTSRPELIQFGALKPGPGIDRLWANTQRLQRETGWAQKFNLADGIQQTIEWWRSRLNISADNFFQKQLK